MSLAFQREEFHLHISATSPELVTLHFNHSLTGLSPPRRPPQDLVFFVSPQVPGLRKHVVHVSCLNERTHV